VEIYLIWLYINKSAILIGKEDLFTEQSGLNEYVGDGKSKDKSTLVKIQQAVL